MTKHDDVRVPVAARGEFAAASDEAEFGFVALPVDLVRWELVLLEGLTRIDLERLRKRYASLLRTATEHIDHRQIIVTDNDSPPIEGIHRTLELSDTDRLVPMPPAEPGEARPADVPPEEEVGD
ncbi:hypothetical protein ACIGW8_36750 [Streptomyces sioyaensis]|uniref:hypothetical protein n=1 Tax=Streptomyces sioyaensis TaxID=67364 RepID=UPI0037D62D50